MNTLDVYGCSISFKTDKKTYDEAWEQFEAFCAEHDISVIGGYDGTLIDENGEEMEYVE